MLEIPDCIAIANLISEARQSALHPTLLTNTSSPCPGEPQADTNPQNMAMKGGL